MVLLWALLLMKQSGRVREHRTQGALFFLWEPSALRCLMWRTWCKFVELPICKKDWRDIFSGAGNR